MGRRDDGVTLVEMLVVTVLVAILMLVALGFHQRARAQAGSVAARSNIRDAVPAIEAYRQDNGSYTAMTLAALQSYGSGLASIEVASADEASYCVEVEVAGQAWHKPGPAAGITPGSCA